VRDTYLSADGRKPESAAACTAGLFFGLTLLPFEDVLEEWRFWREVDDDPQTGANPRLRTLMGSVPPGFVRREYSARCCIPLAADKAGNYLDVAPDERGAAG
jgi:cell wall assembly regulator SMI1